MPEAQTGGQAFEGFAEGIPYPLESASPSRPVDAAVSSVSPMLKPLCVPVTAKVRVILSQVEFGTWIEIFVPPLASSFRGWLRMRSGSFSPHDWLVPVSAVVPVKFVSRRMSTSPVPDAAEPALIAVVWASPLEGDLSSRASTSSATDIRRRRLRRR